MTPAKLATAVGVSLIAFSFYGLGFPALVLGAALLALGESRHLKRR